MSRTYLHNCLKEGYLCRWPDGAMPIRVYIAPFKWYEKKKEQESFVYRQMVLESLDLWRQISHDKIKFLVVDQLHLSQIDFRWRRVDRKSLGHCTYEIDKQHRLFTAEIQIGISDGLLHAAYQDASEVKHTILHEIGHALGLVGHSDEPGDIMYVPHQFGVFTLSERDAETINWLYRLPVGFNYTAIGAKYKLSTGFTINDVIDKIERRIQGQEEEIPTSPAEASGPSIEQPSSFITTATTGGVIAHAETLDEQHQILSEMGRFYLKTQNIQINPQKQDQLRKAILEKRLQNRILPPNT